METNGNLIWLADDIEIAKGYYVRDWKDLRDKRPIVENTNGQDWNDAFKIFETRVNTRFINPIIKISELDPDAGKGEGFSMVALQCILIEFFQTFYEGRTFILKSKDLTEEESQIKYKYSSEMFKNFLTEHKPFSEFFCKHEKKQR